MKWLDSKWFEKIFLTVSSLLLIWLVIGFVVVGGFILLLGIAEFMD